MKQSIIFILLSAGFLFGWSGADGEALLIPPDARSIAMANTTVAIANDVNAIYWNPAGLAQINSLQIGYSHAFWFMDLGYDFIASAYHFKNGDTIGQSIGRFGMPGIDGLTETGTPSGDTIKMSAYFINIAYGVRPFEIYLGFSKMQLFLGASLKIVYELIDTTSLTVPGMDIGTLGKNLFFKGLNLGVSWRNIDISKSTRLPMEIDLGFSYNWEMYKYKRSQIIIVPALSLNYLLDYGFSESTGLEISWTNPGLDLKNTKIRAGYVLAKSDSRSTGLNLGAGLSSYNISVDYALTLYNTLNYTHNLTIKYMFDAIQ